jgi:hypothetical protein
MRNVVYGLVALVSVSAAVAADGIQHFDVALTGLNTDTALVLPSQAVDEHALWSPDSRYLAVNVEGEWLKVDLEGIILAAGAWRGGQTLAVITNREAVSPAASDDIASWQKTNRLHPRKASVGGADVQLRQHELSTALVVTRPGRNAETRWESGMENCHSLVVAPTKRHVAFVCEMNGMFILRVAP